MGREQDLEDQKHEHIMEQMAFQRETELMILEKQWELSVRQVAQHQPQYFEQPLGYQQQHNYPNQSPVTQEQNPEEKKSSSKYGFGRKK